MLKDHLVQSPLWIVHINFTCVIRPLLLRDNAFLSTEWWSLKTGVLYTEFCSKRPNWKVKLFTEHWLHVLAIVLIFWSSHGMHVLVKYKYAQYFLSQNLTDFTLYSNINDRHVFCRIKKKTATRYFYKIWKIAICHVKKKKNNCVKKIFWLWSKW